MTRTELIAKAETLRRLHIPGKPVVLFNAWDAGSAKIVAAEGFPAVATTSAGIAFALGLPDGQRVSGERMLSACAEIAAAVRVPVTADLEAGYGTSPAEVAHTIRRAIAGGIAGANIEDSTPTATLGHALLDFDLSVARITAGRIAAEETGVPFVLNARTDAFFGAKDLAAAFAEAVRRANAYLKAGAVSAFVPFVLDPAIIGRLVKAIHGPVNVLCLPGLTVPQLAGLGVARVSFGGTPMRAALGFLRQAAREVFSAGTQDFAKSAIPHAELNKFFQGV